MAINNKTYKISKISKIVNSEQSKQPVTQELEINHKGKMKV